MDAYCEARMASLIVTCAKSDLIVQTLSEQAVPLIVSCRPHAAIETTEKNRRHCEERSDAAISIRLQ